ncbi:hypothetical protein THAOC_32620 [Thalassiosira oceanica]|uniref:Propionyl-CoA carboxylase n=1 Tax=Thalassiosira oceanica TaxID=159749 RepID=K0RPB3_THAOC|nr:hypothetical protein THAOC_32620 [Thalassiosira oceanica]|eukprot:EJK48572.1 hypothetical protein THAOC_32620 [Thalassiosira oceanica]
MHVNRRPKNESNRTRRRAGRRGIPPRPGRGPVLLRGRPPPRREVRRGPPTHRDTGPLRPGSRHGRPRRPMLRRAGVQHTEEEPEGPRGESQPDARQGDSEGDDKAGQEPGEGGGLRERGDRRVLGGRGAELLLPRDEHEAPGRAPGHRDDKRRRLRLRELRRPRPRHARGGVRTGRAPGVPRHGRVRPGPRRAGRGGGSERQVHGTRRRGEGLRRGSLPGIPAEHRTACEVRRAAGRAGNRGRGGIGDVLVSFSSPSKRDFGEIKVTDASFPFLDANQKIQSDEEGKNEERRDGGGELCDGDYDNDNPRDEGSKKSACHIRVDTGVAPGYVVSPHYDPILSKIISYSETSRAESIEGLGRAIDRYKLRGVMHNVPFIRDVLRNADFVRGETPTGFIDAHYPDGFSGGRLTATEMKEYAAIAALVHERRRAETGGPPLPMDAGEAGGGGPQSAERIVCVNGMFGDAYRVRTEVGPGGFTTCSVARLGDDEDVETVVKSDRGDVNYHPRDDFACVPVSSDDSRVVQVHGEDEMGQLKLTMFGLDADFLVTTPGEYELTRHMKEPVPVDLGDYVMSPMPGTLVSFAVKEGDVVEMGQELCVVEAMKMQNIIRSHKAGARVSKLHGEVGASLRADEILLEFEKETTEEEEEEVA